MMINQFRMLLNKMNKNIQMRNQTMLKGLAKN